MKISKITLTYGETRSQSYQSARAELTVEVELDDDESFATANSADGIEAHVKALKERVIDQVTGITSAEVERLVAEAEQGGGRRW